MTDGITLEERQMFTSQARDELRDRVVDMAREDPRVVSAAEVGSLSAGAGDRWSDLDLTFAVDDGVSVEDVLRDWSAMLIGAGAVVLFDLMAGPSIYRVFMFPDCLQLDLSFSSATEFRPTGPRFRLIFGAAGPMRATAPPEPAELLGWAVMWARHARVCIERGHLRRAEHAVWSMRERALDFACRRRDLPAGYGRGLEQLPPEVYDRFGLPGVPALEPSAISRSLEMCVAGLSAECAEAPGVDEALPARLLDTIAGL